MTIETIFTGLSNAGRLVPILLFLIPLATFVISWMHGVYDGRRAPWRQIYGLAVQVTTLFLTALAALIALYILEGGTVRDVIVPRTAFYYVAGTWLLTLLVVKRAVDFIHIPAVKNPLLLLFGWVLAWAVGMGLYISGLWLVPGPPLYTTLLAVAVFFLIFEMILALSGPRR